MISHIDLSGIENLFLEFLISVALGMLSYLLHRIAAKYNIQISADQSYMFDSALHAANTYGLTKAEDTIKAKGWDHVDTKNATLGVAIPYLVSRFPDALKAVGLAPNLDDPANVAKITGALERAFPAAVASAVSSPATPPPDAAKPDSNVLTLPAKGVL